MRDMKNIDFGPMGSVYTLPSVSCQAILTNADAADQWLSVLEDKNPSRSMQAVAALCRIVPKMTSSYDQKLVDVSNKVADALDRIYPKLDPLTQCWMIRFLPTVAEDGVHFQQTRQLMQRGDPRAMMVYLTMHVNDPKSPMLDAAQRLDDETLTKFTKSYRNILTALVNAKKP